MLVCTMYVCMYVALVWPFVAVSSVLIAAWLLV